MKFFMKSELSASAVLWLTTVSGVDGTSKYDSMLLRLSEATSIFAKCTDVGEVRESVTVITTI